jgi:integrase
LTTQTKLRTGEKVFDTTLGELVEVYMNEQKQRIRVGAVGKGDIGITEGRFVTIRTQVERHLVGFLGIDTKLSTIRKDTFRHKYTQYRRKNNPLVQDVTLVNERATIGNVFRHALELGWIQPAQLPLWEEMAKNANKRDAFTQTEWKEIYKYLHSWSNKKMGAKELRERDFIKYFILLLANTGLRFGEARLLRWGNISIFSEDKVVKSKIKVEVGKTGKRVVIGRRGDLFQKIKKLSQYTNNDDYVFVDGSNGEQLATKTYYRYWDEIIKNTSLKDKQPKPVYYCLRHTYATFRLYADVPIDKLATNMGCSVTFIEKHYGHVQQEKISKTLTQNWKKDESSKFIMEL